MEERESDRQRKNKKSKNIELNIKKDAAEVWKRKTKKWNEVQMRTKERKIDVKIQRKSQDVVKVRNN